MQNMDNILKKINEMFEDVSEREKSFLEEQGFDSYESIQ